VENLPQSLPILEAFYSKLFLAGYSSTMQYLVILKNVSALLYAVSSKPGEKISFQNNCKPQKITKI
jgi:hypothetical protein